MATLHDIQQWAKWLKKSERDHVAPINGSSIDYPPLSQQWVNRKRKAQFPGYQTALEDEKEEEEEVTIMGWGLYYSCTAKVIVNI